VVVTISVVKNMNVDLRSAKVKLEDPRLRVFSAGATFALEQHGELRAFCTG
jgi:hypothetical protein